MSMLSAQIDELRKWADQLSERENEFGVVVRALVAVLRDAADTICQLRDDLQTANADNAKLVDVLHEVETDAVYAYHCLQQDCMTTADSSEHFFKKWWHAECELDRLKAENAKLREYIERKKVLQDYARLFDNNAKLRELCAGLLTGYECGHGELCKGCTWDGLGDPKTFPCLPRVKARELGIEVGE